MVRVLLLLVIFLPFNIQASWFFFQSTFSFIDTVESQDIKKKED